MVKFTEALMAGAMAGTAVDTILFPLDTIKTRLQSKQGFLKAGGFKRIYSGLSSAVAGSAPSAALFFVGYETCKKNLGVENAQLKHMISASIGEIMACLVRVPTEIMKQRMQVAQLNNLPRIFNQIYSANGISGFYKGFGITIFREIPFACIQFPLYEFLKVELAKVKQVSSIDAGLCGMVAGGTAAALTTPLDVLKTRIMLKNSATFGIVDAFLEVKTQGYRYFFAGIVPRVFWISIGGSIFLGVYDKAVKLLAADKSE